MGEILEFKREKTKPPSPNSTEAPRLNRATARALAEAGYMPLDEYIERFGQLPEHDYNGD